MSGEPENLVLEHLRSIRSDLAAIRQTQSDHTLRLNELTRLMTILRRDRFRRSD